VTRAEQHQPAPNNINPRRTTSTRAEQHQPAPNNINPR
jgi:hypothetical protein